MFKKDEKAVSPVIGVILMVAITVILAAVIASFVFGMGSSVKKTYVVSATASEQYNSSSKDYDITVTYQGGPDHASVSWINITLPDSDWDEGDITNTSCTVDPDTTNERIQVTNLSTGATVTVFEAGSTGRDHVIVVGHFADGTEQVILDTYV